MATLHFVDDYDNNWDSVDNWFTQVTPTQIAAGRIPIAGDEVILYSTLAAGPSVAISLASLTVHPNGQLSSGTTANITTASLVVDTTSWDSYWAGTASTANVSGGNVLIVSGSLGNNVNIADNAKVTGADGTIGNGCTIGSGCTLDGTMTVGTGCSSESNAPSGWVYGNAYEQSGGEFNSTSGTTTFSGVTVKGGQTGNLIADSTTTLSAELSGFTVAGTASLSGTSLEVAALSTVQVTGITTFAAGSYQCASGGSFSSSGANINSGGVSFTIGEGCAITLGTTKVYGVMQVTRQGSGYLSASVTLNHASASISFEGNVSIDVTNVVLPVVGNVLAGQTYGLDGNDKVGTLPLRHVTKSTGTFLRV